ncbi:MAG: MMPL family transporter [Candidatus Hodarchaeales archaeon]
MVNISYGASNGFLNELINTLGSSETNTSSTLAFDPSLIQVEDDDSTIQVMHDGANQFLSGYLSLWYDYSRAIYYLYNYTDAYTTNILDPLDYPTINATWNETLGIPQNTTFTFIAFNSTNQTVPGIGLPYGIVMQMDPFLADKVLNNLVYNSLSANIVQESQEYQLLYLLNQSWYTAWDSETNFTFGLFNPLFDDYLGVDNTTLGTFGPPPFVIPQQLSQNIELSQLGIFQRLTRIQRDSFKEYINLLSEINPPTYSIINATPSNTTLPNITSTLTEGDLTEITLNIYSELSEIFITNLSYSSDFINMETIQYLLESFETYLTDLKISLKALKTLDINILNEFVINFVGGLFSSDSTSFIGDNLDFSNFGEVDVNIELVIEPFNVTDFVEKTLLAGKSGLSSEDVNNITNKSASQLMQGILQAIPEPTIENLPESIRHSFISPQNKTMLITIEYDESPEEKDLARQIKLIRSITQNEIIGTILEGKVKIYVTGELAISYDFDHTLEEDIEKIDIVTVVLVLILLTIVFRSFVTPTVPLLSIGMALFMGIGVLSIVSDIQNLSIPSLMIAVMTVIMFGAGVDYCLFILARYREERQNGKPKYRAVKEAVIHAGESVTSSGMTVMIGFGSLLLSSFILLNQMGLGPMIGIAFSLIAALTLIPFALLIFGDKLFWWRNFDKEYGKKLAHKKVEDDLTKNLFISEKNSKIKKKRSFFRRIAQFTVNHPWFVIITFLILSTPFIYLATTVQPSYDNTDILPVGVESVEGIQALQGSFPLGSFFPVVATMEFKEPINNSNYFNISQLQLVEDFAQYLLTQVKNEKGDPIYSEVRTITRPSGYPINFTDPDTLNSLSMGMMLQYISIKTDNATVIINALSLEDPIGEEALNAVGDIREWREDIGKTDTRFSSDNVEILIGGSPGAFREIQQIIDRESPILIGFVILGIYLVLFFLLGSVFTPIRLEFTILLTVFISLGASQLVFVLLLGRGIPWILPIMLTVLIFGLGIDYDIFIVTRMREEVAYRGATDTEAIVTAIEKTGGVITAAGIIMASALGSLMIAQSNILQIMGFAFFVAILLDATVVRMFLVPAIMVVMGKNLNWWNPIKGLERVPSKEERKRLRTEFIEETELASRLITEDEIKYKQRKLKTEYKEFYGTWRKLVLNAQRYRHFSNSEMQNFKKYVTDIKTSTNERRESYNQEDQELVAALSYDFRKNRNQLNKINDVLRFFDEIGFITEN